MAPMPSEVLNAETDYQFPAPPAPALLDRENWNGVMASLSTRLKALEAVNTGIEAIKQQLSALGLGIINESITPLIDDVEANVATLQGQVGALATTIINMIADFQAQ